MQLNQFWPQWMKLKFALEVSEAKSGLKDIGWPLNLSINQDTVVSNLFLCLKK